MSEFKIINDSFKSFLPNTDTDQAQENQSLPVVVNPAPVQEATEEAGQEENKSRRVNALVRPSLFAEVQKLAKQKHISFNEALNQALTEWAERNGGK